MKRPLLLIAVVVGAIVAAGAQYIPPANFFGFKSYEDVYHSFTSDNDSAAYTGTAISTGTLATTNGQLVLSGAATTDNSGYQIQLEGFPVQLENGKQYDIASEIDMGATGEWHLGFSVSDTSIEASAPTDAILISRNETTLTTLDVLVRSNSTDALNTTVTGVVADGVWGVRWQQKSATTGDLILFYNGRSFRTFTGITSPRTSVWMTPSIVFQSTSNSGTQTASFANIHARWQN